MDELNLLTVADVARRFEVTERTARGWCKRGLFPNAIQTVKTGRGAIWLIPARDLETFERPTMGYPKGRPRTSKDPDAGDPDQEVTE